MLKKKTQQRKKSPANLIGGESTPFWVTSQCLIKTRVLIINMQQWGIFLMCLSPSSSSSSQQPSVELFTLVQGDLGESSCWTPSGGDLNWLSSSRVSSTVYTWVITDEYYMLCSPHTKKVVGSIPQGLGRFSSKPCECSTNTSSPWGTSVLFHTHDTVHILSFKFSWTLGIKLDGKVSTQTQRPHDNILRWCLSSAAIGLVSPALWRGWDKRLQRLCRQKWKMGQGSALGELFL